MRKTLWMLAGLGLCLGAIAAAGEDGGFVSLFDGKTLKGWAVKGGTATYKVEDETIVGATTEGSPNTFLCTEKEYADFELVLEVKCDKDLNSGIQIRSHVYEKDTPMPGKAGRTVPAGHVYGYQCEISPSNAGNFYDEARRATWLAKLSADAQKAYKPDDWNTYRIVARGDRIQSWVNGVACADFRDPTDARGLIGLQVHGIRKGAGPYQVRWRNIRIRELKAEG